MAVELSGPQRELLEGANPAVISTVDEEGNAVSVITWFLFEAPDRILLSIVAANARGGRLAHLRQRGQFSLTVMDSVDWMQSTTVLATVEEFGDDVALELIDRMAAVHGFAGYGSREPRTSVYARIRRLQS